MVSDQRHSDMRGRAHWMIQTHTRMYTDANRIEWAGAENSPLSRLSGGRESGRADRD